jgi:NAD-dependent dihydropyrimidine dehydrogenase PreA subunit
MSKSWYPVIDYVKCAECGSCVKMCRHGVYDKSKAPTPVVVYPAGCIEGCKGCGNKCPNHAIQYVGDIENDSACSCGCSCS